VKQLERIHGILGYKARGKNVIHFTKKEE